MESTIDFGRELIKMAGSLALVLGILALGVLLLKRFGNWVKKPQSQSSIQVLARYPLGLKHHLLLVKVQDQSFVLGISPQGMQLISPPQPTPGFSHLSEVDGK